MTFQDILQRAVKCDIIEEKNRGRVRMRERAHLFRRKNSPKKIEITGDGKEERENEDRQQSNG